jgi:hypothetical protein
LLTKLKIIIKYKEYKIKISKPAIKSKRNNKTVYVIIITSTVK